MLRHRAVVAVVGAALALVARADVSGEEVTFGLTGSFNASAQKDTVYALRAGLEVGFAAQNERNGVHGRMLRLVVADDGGDPNRTVAALRELIERRKVFATIGMGTSTAASTVNYANEAGVVHFPLMGGSRAVNRDPPDRFIFTSRANHGEETGTLVRYLMQVKKVEPDRIAVFAQTDELGDSAFEGIVRALRPHRVDARRMLRVGYERNSADAEDAARAVLKSPRQPQAIIMIGSYKALTRFVEKIRDAGLDKVVLAGISICGTTELAEELGHLGPKYAEGVILTQVMPSPYTGSVGMLRFRTPLAKHAVGLRPGYTSFEGWLLSQIIIEGLQRAGRDLTTSGFVDGLEGIKDLDLNIGMSMSYGPSDHQGSHKVWITTLDGKGNLRPVTFNNNSEGPKQVSGSWKGS